MRPTRSEADQFLSGGCFMLAWVASREAEDEIVLFWDDEVDDRHAIHAAVLRGGHAHDARGAYRIDQSSNERVTICSRDDLVSEGYVALVDDTGEPEPLMLEAAEFFGRYRDHMGLPKKSRMRR